MPSRESPNTESYNESGLETPPLRPQFLNCPSDEIWGSICTLPPLAHPIPVISEPNHRPWELVGVDVGEEFGAEHNGLVSVPNPLDVSNGMFIRAEVFACDS